MLDAVTGKVELGGVVDPAKPPIVMIVGVVQVVNNGTLAVNVMVKVFELHGFEVNWLAVAANVRVRRLRGSASPLARARVLLAASNTDTCVAKAPDPVLGTKKLGAPVP